MKKMILKLFDWYLKMLEKIPALFCCPNEKILYNCDWILKLEKVFYISIRFLPYYSITRFSSKYSSIIKKAVGNNHNLYISLKSNWITKFDELNDRQKLFMSFLFYECDIFDSEIAEKIMNFSQNTLNYTYRYWISMYISKMCFFKQNGFYPEYYNDRKIVLRQIAEEIGRPKVTEPVKDKQRIVIITYLLDDKLKNSMQRVATMFANNLKKEDNEVTVLCLDSLYQSKKERSKLIELIHYNKSCKKATGIQKLFEPNVNIKYSSGENYIERMKNSLEILYQISPDIIVDIADEYSPLSFHYSKDFFTVYVPMRAAATSQFYSAILGVPFKYEQTNLKFNNCIDMSKVLEWSFPEYIPPEQGTITKKDIGLSDEQFCIISIGNNSCFSADFIDEICQLLNSNDKLVWLLVGSPSPDYLHQTYANLLKDKQVIEWGYENNLAGICKACDVHLRYDVTGGSGGTAIAAMQGLPIVMSNFVCDASRWLGLDYSSIDNFHDLANEVQRLYSDKKYYDERKQVALELVSKAVDSEEKWKNLNNILTDAYERWKTEGHV